ncbi:uncharacterized protein ACA1_165240 [Acanthamoeba castellanii str. Neff]|uniref:Uncharacterized protein n=1 Tax=Acanthamoeba castellanii (strain ATCC 30010 / Neff) TaxID=1257118 RepID=L8HFM9_ACACF|nr:uncharacterized protein ACA1_165240 [Acanthamoeba castellanii str. Neff]ELR24334.1 hypothetical protein ACA1_165240 [Acanthamoeba castellanii str. Neff]
MDRRAEGWAERVVEGEKTAAPGRRSVTLPGSGEEESTGPSSGTSSSSSLSVRPTRRLLRVMVVDYPTGIALFHHTWAWKGDPNVAGIAKVIVAFYKLSQSLGGRGDTNYVLFDPPPEGRRRSQQDLYSIKSKRASGGAGLRPMIASPRPRKPRIRCVFSKVDHVVVGLFHEIGDKLELPRQCGDAILREFVAQYGDKLASMRHIFEDMIDEKKARPTARHSKRP